VVHSKGEAIVISNPFRVYGSSGPPAKSIVALEELKPVRSVDEFLTIAIEGEAMRNFSIRESLLLLRLISIFLAATKALMVLHENSVLYNDVTPASIFYDVMEKKGVSMFYIFSSADQHERSSTKPNSQTLRVPTNYKACFIRFVYSAILSPSDPQIPLHQTSTAVLSLSLSLHSHLSLMEQTPPHR